MAYAALFNLRKKIMIIFCRGQIVRGGKKRELKSQIALVHFHGILVCVLESSLIPGVLFI